MLMLLWDMSLVVVAVVDVFVLVAGVAVRL